MYGRVIASRADGRWALHEKTAASRFLGLSGAAIWVDWGEYGYRWRGVITHGLSGSIRRRPSLIPFGSMPSTPGTKVSIVQHLTPARTHFGRLDIVRHAGSLLSAD
jgi:hypothetical protein